MINIIFIFLSQLKFTNVGDILKKFKEKKFFFEDRKCLYLPFNRAFFSYLTMKKPLPYLGNGQKWICEYYVFIILVH